MSSSSGLIVTFLYPRTSTSHFDLPYYLSHHIPTAKSLWEPLGMKTVYVSEMGDANAEYAVQATLIWTDRASWEQASSGPAMQQLGDDVKNFTDVTPVLVVGTIVG